MTDSPRIPKSILIVSLLMMLFGLAEVATAFSHHFFGITTTETALATYSSALIGVLYILAGLVILPMKKWGVLLAIVFLVADILGRLALVANGLYPLNGIENTFGIIAGTAIAVIFANYIASQRAVFR